MNRVSNLVYRGAMLTALLAVVFGVGCTPKPKPKAPETPTTPTTPPPARPTVSIQANPTSIDKGGSTTLSWTSTDATQLTIAPDVGAVNAQGSTQVSPASSTTYTITASGPGGSADSSVRVTVNQPAPVQQAPQIDIGTLFDQNVKDAYFDFNKADIRADARDALGKTADFLRQYPQVRAKIEGRCDERGSTEYNIALGDRRANAVKNYLVQLGISADRLTPVSLGKEQQLCGEHTEECWQRNRVGHFVRVQ